jgi:hypothetical protein
MQDTAGDSTNLFDYSLCTTKQGSKRIGRIDKVKKSYHTLITSHKVIPTEGILDDKNYERIHL